MTFHDDAKVVYTNGHSHTNGHVVPLKAKAVNVAKVEQDVDVMYSSSEIIEMENEYGAHNYHPIPVVFERAKGAKVWDPEGKEYIDMLSAYSAVNQGHCHPRLVQALITQSQKVTLSSRAFYNSVFGQFAKQITTLFGYEMVMPMNSGAEAVETAIKLARKWGYVKKGIEDGKAMVLSCENNFHGRTLGIISMSSDPECRRDYGPYLENVGPVYQTPTGETMTIRYNHIEDLQKAMDIHGERIAAFLLEPIQGEAGIVVPSDEYLRQVRDLCTKHNVLMICDEIQTGLSRTGKLLAHHWAGIRPDIVILGKALSGGMYPVSAVLADRDIMLVIKPGEHGSTYGGNPLGCAIAMTALDILISENLAERAERLGQIFRSSIRALNSPFVLEVRGRGLLNAVVIDNKKSTKGRTAWSLCLLLKEKGVLAKPTHDNIIRFAPPLVIEESDLRKALQTIADSLAQLDTVAVIPGDDASH